MQGPEALEHYAFDQETFAALVRDHRAGAFSGASKVLPAVPSPLRPQDPDAPVALRLDPGARLGDAASGAADDEADLRQLGEDAIRAGRVALLIMAGGMATRFGGGAKGAACLRPDGEATFLSLALAQNARLARSLAASIPVVVMTSFATSTAIDAHLETIGWGGVPESDRFRFEQSIVPRLDREGIPLTEREDARSWPASASCSAPGHGDTLARLRGSGVLAELMQRGVQHLLVANVDNLGAVIDPTLVGAHIRAVQGGASISVELVRRAKGDRGGCVARLQDGRVAIVEAFRLPAEATLEDYPHFNTNSLWFELAALDQELPLEWFAVEKEITSPAGERMGVIQFERLIGQATELLPSAYLEVPRARRFLPVKTRDDLVSLREVIDARLAAIDAATV